MLPHPMKHTRHALQQPSLRNLRIRLQAYDHQGQPTTEKDLLDGRSLLLVVKPGRAEDGEPEMRRLADIVAGIGAPNPPIWSV